MPRLSVADALAIHHAIHSTADTVTLADGTVCRIIVSANRCRRCDLPLGMFSSNAKLMAQNMDKDSAAAKRARQGAQITHIIPLGANGQHGTYNWGMIEDGRIAKKCFVLEDPTRPPQDPARTPHGHLRAACTYLDCPYNERTEAKRTGALWDAEGEGSQKAWYVPPGLPLAPFQRWVRLPAPPAAAAAAPAPPAAAAAAPATAAEDEVVKETGSRSWAEKDAELRSAAVVIEEAEGAVPPAKRAKMAAAASAKVQVKVESQPQQDQPPASTPPQASSAPSPPTASRGAAPASGGAPSPASGSVKDMADRLASELGLAGAKIPEVAKAACGMLEVDRTGSLAAQILACYEKLFAG